MNIKGLIRSTVNRLGFNLSKLPEKIPSVLPSKTEGGIGFYQTSHGNYFLPLNVSNDIVINCIKAGLIFEPEVVETAKRFIKKGTTVLDVGSNFGQMAIAFSKMVGENGVVYAFEADDFVFELLKKNIEANGCKNIIPVFGAVYSESGEEFFFPKQDFKRFDAYGSYGIDLTAKSGRIVKSLMIDDLEFEKPVSFMKVDAQGSDLFAMQGARHTIEKHKMPILFEFEQQFQKEFETSFQDYVEFVNSVDYKFIETILAVNYLIDPK